MSFSYYEIYVTCLRAFTAIGFTYGADEDAAYIVTWLELNKFDGIKNFAKLYKKINNKFNGNFKNINLELKNRDCLIKTIVDGIQDGLDLPDINKNIIITGPNAAGKTTSIKATIINLLLTHCKKSEASSILK